MNRRQVLVAGGALSALLVLYCVGFGPFVYCWAKANRHGFVPQWLDDGLGVVCYPHRRCMYHSKPYFTYIFWFVDQAAGPLSYTWEEFRQTQDQD
jgi:hypothetical protein